MGAWSRERMRASMRSRLAATLAVATSIAGCAGAPRIVSLVAPGGGPLGSMPPGAMPLEVASRSTAVSDPLPVRGSAISYGELDAALGIAITTATAPWAASHRDDSVAKKGGWTV